MVGHSANRTDSTTQTTDDGLDLPFVLSSWRIVSAAAPLKKRRAFDTQRIVKYVDPDVPAKW